MERKVGTVSQCAVLFGAAALVLLLKAPGCGDT